MAGDLTSRTRTTGSFMVDGGGGERGCELWHLKQNVGQLGRERIIRERGSL